MKKDKAITLIALVITIIVLLILAGVTFLTLTGQNGILGKSNKAKEENNQQTATEILNLKITNVQMSKYTEEQRMPTLKELADSLDPEKDKDIKSVTKTRQKVSSLDWINDNDYSSIFTILKDYPQYEFEIDKNLKLATINGVKVADDTSNNVEIDELKTMIGTLQNRITQLEETTKSQQETIASLQTGTKESKIDYHASLNTEKEIGTWYDGSPMYELSLEITMPNVNSGGTEVTKEINLEKYDMKGCVINGYFYDVSDYTSVTAPIWGGNGVVNARMYYSGATKKLIITSSSTAFNGRKGYVTLHYKK